MSHYLTRAKTQFCTIMWGELDHFQVWFQSKWQIFSIRVLRGHDGWVPRRIYDTVHSCGTCQVSGELICEFLTTIILFSIGRHDGNALFCFRDDILCHWFKLWRIDKRNLRWCIGYYCNQRSASGTRGNLTSLHFFEDCVECVLACSYGLPIRQKTEKHTSSLRNPTSFLTLEWYALLTLARSPRLSTCAKSCVVMALTFPRTFGYFHRPAAWSTFGKAVRSGDAGRQLIHIILQFVKQPLVCYTCNLIFVVNDALCQPIGKTWTCFGLKPKHVQSPSCKSQIYPAYTSPKMQYIWNFPHNP